MARFANDVFSQAASEVEERYRTARPIGWPKKLHHDWLPADDEANTSVKPYYLPKPWELWQMAAELRANRPSNHRDDHCPATHVPTRRAFD